MALAVDSTRRLVRRDAISVREQGSCTAIILIAWLLRHRAWPGEREFPRKVVIAEDHVGDACALGRANP